MAVLVCAHNAHSIMHAKYIKVAGINTIIYALYIVHAHGSIIAMRNNKLLFLNAAKVIFYQRMQQQHDCSV